MGECEKNIDETKAGREHNKNRNWERRGYKNVDEPKTRTDGNKREIFKGNNSVKATAI